MVCWHKESGHHQPWFPRIFWFKHQKGKITGYFPIQNEFLSFIFSDQNLLFSWSCSKIIGIELVMWILIPLGQGISSNNADQFLVMPQWVSRCLRVCYITLHNFHKVILLKILTDNTNWKAWIKDGLQYSVMMIIRFGTACFSYIFKQKQSDIFLAETRNWYMHNLTHCIQMMHIYCWMRSPLVR